MAAKKNDPRREARIAKNNRNLNSALTLFTAGFIAEFYLLLINQYFVKGSVDQVVAIAGYLEVMAIVGAAAFGAGVVLTVMRRKWTRFAAVGKWLLGLGLFFGVSSLLMRRVYPMGTTVMCILVPVLMLLAVVFLLYQHEFAVQAIALTLAFLLKLTRLRQVDLRIALPAPWSPGFCLPVFLGVANLANLAGALINHITDNPTTSELLPSGGPELLVCFITLCIMPAVAEELLFRGAFQGLMRPCGSAAAIFAPALLFGLLHLDLAQGLTAFACGVFLGWLTERSGSILPGMLLHLVNNTLAFLTIYLRYYAPAELSFGVELFILLFFPVFGGWMIWNARQQGFRFSAGLRPGVDVLAVFTSPAYSAAVIFLVVYAAFFVH